MTKKKKVYTPRSPIKRAKGAVAGLVMHLVAVAAFAAMMAINLSHLLARVPDEPLSDPSLVPGFETYAMAYGLAAIAQIATLIVYGVLFFMWVHRTNRNAQSLATGMEVSLAGPWDGSSFPSRRSTNPSKGWIRPGASASTQRVGGRSIRPFFCGCGGGCI
jgi:hypothetical protein